MSHKGRQKICKLQSKCLTLSEDGSQTKWNGIPCLIVTLMFVKTRLNDIPRLEVILMTDPNGLWLNLTNIKSNANRVEQEKKHKLHSA